MFSSSPLTNFNLTLLKQEILIGWLFCVDKEPGIKSTLRASVESVATHLRSRRVKSEAVGKYRWSPYNKELVEIENARPINCQKLRRIFVLPKISAGVLTHYSKM